MTDIQTWRRNKHLSASRVADITGYGSSSEDISLSMPPNEYARRRPRTRKSLASFASYLGAHRTPSGSKSELPSIDWSNINAEDHVYRPDLDYMCTTLQRHVLNNPSTDLPAQYNSFVLHILESYYRLQDDKKELERKLQAEEERHQTDAHEFNLMIQSLLRTSGPSIAMTAELCCPEPTGDMSASSSEKTRMSNGKLDSLLSKFDTGYSRKPKRCNKGLGTQGSRGDSMGKQYANQLRHFADHFQLQVNLNHYDCRRSAVGTRRLRWLWILTMTLPCLRLLLRPPDLEILQCRAQKTTQIRTIITLWR